MRGWKEHAVGKRKNSVARVFVKDGSGKITVNGKDYQDYFGRETLKMVLRQPLVITDNLETYDIQINVCGGGTSGQAGACRHGISRALDKINEENRKLLKPVGLLTRDQREVERKKYGRHKARKKPQFSKR